MKASNDSSTTLITDAVLAALAPTLPAELRWQLEGWAAHIRPARHANHAANSWAKHLTAFGRIHREAELVTVARLADAGLSAPAAVALLAERVGAHALKAA